METKILTTSFTDTQIQGENFAKAILFKEKGPYVLLLSGQLGAGKTTFIQGFAKGVGIERRIISPTFIIVRKYEIPNFKFQISNFKFFYHIDLYRTQIEEDLLGLGLSEILQEKNAIIAIEWPEKLGFLLPKNRWEIHFATIGENKREIIIKKL